MQVAVTQSISGTGALRIGGAFLARHYPHSKAIYLPVPTWGNHIPIFRDSGLEVRGYRYFNKETVGLDFEGLKADLKVLRLPLFFRSSPLILDHRQPRSSRSYSSMLAPTTQLVLILPRNSGLKSPIS
jgi:hypothetical protein